MSSLTELAKQYIEWDPNPETRAQVQQLLDSQSENELQKLLMKRVQFGTAGLRAAMGPGYCCMNDLVVLQTCQGLCRYLESLDPETKTKGIVVGYDHRQLSSLSSQGFAFITAAVFISQGFKVYLLDNFVATPFVPFAIGHFHAAAGIMVTASHNPKQDNGYKVYWGNGAQIIPPHDLNISKFIQENLKPWQQYDLNSLHNHSLVKRVTEQVADAYMLAIVKMSSRRAKNSSSTLRVAYTAMHGVGCQWITRAFAAYRHPELLIVSTQQHPDATFPTVSFPNPEEKGALNESLKFANEHNCTIILANDPDADRLAVAEKNVSTNTWKVFSGNEIGVLLGYWQIQLWKSINPTASAAVLASIVSSRMLKTIAKVEGFQYYDTLTGFKWLGNRAMELRAHDTPVVFCYEEALGYCVGDVLCDKDGISAASVFMEMASALQNGWTETGGEASGPSRTIQDLLQDLGKKYGEFISYNSYVISHDPMITNEIFTQLRHHNASVGGYWQSCAGVPITAIQDITKGYDSTMKDHRSLLPQTPDSHMIMYEFANGISVTLRTSGTEPKIKYYTEIAGQPGQSREELQIILHTFVDALVEEMLQPTKYGLGRP